MTSSDEPFLPNWASPPGDSIQEGLEHREMSVEDFSRRVGLTLEETKDLLKGNFRILPEHAEKLAEYLGGTPMFWMRRDAQYLESLARLANNRIKEYVDGTPGTCPECQRTSHHPMDVFFRWCPGCELNYSGLEYRNEERYWLGQIHTDHPDWTLEQVLEHARK